MNNSSLRFIKNTNAIIKFRPVVLKENETSYYFINYLLSWFDASRRHGGEFGPSQRFLSSLLLNYLIKEFLINVLYIDSLAIDVRILSSGISWSFFKTELYENLVSRIVLLVISVLVLKEVYIEFSILSF